MRLADKVAIVTGAGATGLGVGVGQAIALRFAQEGARLVLVDRDRAAAERTVRWLAEQRFGADTVIGDVATEETARAAVDAALSARGRIDVVVSSVGIAGPVSLMNETRESWDRVFAVNCTGALLMSQAAVPHMLEQGRGAFVHVSSINAHRTTGKLESYAYGASKAALIRLSSMLAMEFAGRGLRSNVVTPGMLDTPMARSAKHHNGWTDAELAQWLASRDAASPTGKQGVAADIANAALYLVSDEAAFVNGQEIIVDGGNINLAPGGASPRAA